MKTQTGLLAEFPLLVQDDDGRLTEKDFTVPLAASGQLAELAIRNKDKGKKKRLTYRSAHQTFEGDPGGAELLFHRPYLEFDHSERTDEDLLLQPGPVWFKLTLKVQPQAPEGWVTAREGQVKKPSEF